MWLYFGDNYVPLRQARRALLTWARKNGRAHGWAEAKASARQLLAVLPPETFGKDERTRVIEELAKVLYTGLSQTGQALTLRERLLAAVGTTGTEGDGPLSLAEAQVDVLIARLEVIPRLSELSGAWFHWARLFLVSGLSEYQLGREQIAAHFGPGLTAEPVTLNNMFGRACADLLTVLGMGLTIPDAGPADPHMHTTLSTQPIGSPLFLPSGEHPMTGLNFQGTVESRPDAHEI